ncbi:Os03g0258100 [Oryza sativa Japonica Group]|uniref:Os03g0258100 protein n=1 Tax=Oryza sativa subsp. japonica TaxID=39947 RepID=A0A0N7KGY8_ORYSJ|nr:Os03g0258100 [Oryza sativa Japonica Group]
MALCGSIVLTEDELTRKRGSVYRARKEKVGVFHLVCKGGSRLAAKRRHMRPQLHPHTHLALSRKCWILYNHHQNVQQPQGQTAMSKAM